MTTDADELVTRWIAAWSHVRDIRVEQVDDVPLLHVRSRTRGTEIIALDPVPQLWDALVRRTVGDPRAMLTAVGSDLAGLREIPLPAGVRVDRDDETLMVGQIDRIEPDAIGPGFTIRWDVEDRLATVRVEDGDRVAAEGTVGVLDAVAVFDAVETTPAYRRRGLARFVMAALVDHAARAGASDGILAASAQGRALYTSLGWRPALDMWSLMGVAPAE